ncbi:hypothetical protein XENORESO_001688 [Xenotaenia resolanae]|uniref:Uncharacterized protein n=1 Tax=Xenotaenia resolanae TaxID=208358 RepID=A0ABV0WDR2_9TELE
MNYNWATKSQPSATTFCTRHLLQFLRGESKAFPGQPRDIVPPAYPVLCPGPGKPPKLPPDGRVLHSISKGVPSHPTEEAHFNRLYPGSRSFGHGPKFMAIGESRNVERR